MIWIVLTSIIAAVLLVYFVIRVFNRYMSRMKSNREIRRYETWEENNSKDDFKHIKPLYEEKFIELEIKGCCESYEVTNYPPFIIEVHVRNLVDRAIGMIIPAGTAFISDDNEIPSVVTLSEVKYPVSASGGWYNLIGVNYLDTHGILPTRSFPLKSIEMTDSSLARFFNHETWKGIDRLTRLPGGDYGVLKRREDQKMACIMQAGTWAIRQGLTRKEVFDSFRNLIFDMEFLSFHENTYSETIQLGSSSFMFENKQIRSIAEILKALGISHHLG
jgi:hypothetical protein